MFLGNPMKTIASLKCFATNFSNFSLVILSEIGILIVFCTFTFYYVYHLFKKFNYPARLPCIPIMGSCKQREDKSLLIRFKRLINYN